METCLTSCERTDQSAAAGSNEVHRSGCQAAQNGPEQAARRLLDLVPGGRTGHRLAYGYHRDGLGHHRLEQLCAHPAQLHVERGDRCLGLQACGCHLGRTVTGQLTDSLRDTGRRTGRRRPPEQLLPGVTEGGVYGPCPGQLKLLPLLGGQFGLQVAQNLPDKLPVDITLLQSQPVVVVHRPRSVLYLLLALLLGLCVGDLLLAHQSALRNQINLSDSGTKDSFSSRRRCAFRSSGAEQSISVGAGRMPDDTLRRVSRPTGAASISARPRQGSPGIPNRSTS